MVADDRHDRIREVDFGKNFCAHARMRLHAFELGRRELARLVENVLRHGELADIVQQCGGLDRADLLLVVNTHARGERDGHSSGRGGCARA